MLHVDGLKNGGPSAKEIPLGAFLGACHFDAEILSFKIIWLEALFDAPKPRQCALKVEKTKEIWHFRHWLSRQCPLTFADNRCVLGACLGAY